MAGIQTFFFLLSSFLIDISVNTKIILRYITFNTDINETEISF